MSDPRPAIAEVWILGALSLSSHCHASLEIGSEPRPAVLYCVIRPEPCSEVLHRASKQKKQVRRWRRGELPLASTGTTSCHLPSQCTGNHSASSTGLPADTFLDRSGHRSGDLAVCRCPCRGVMCVVRLGVRTSRCTSSTLSRAIRLDPHEINDAFSPSSSSTRHIQRPTSLPSSVPFHLSMPTTHPSIHPPKPPGPSPSVVLPVASARPGARRFGDQGGDRCRRPNLCKPTVSE